MVPVRIRWVLLVLSAVMMSECARAPRPRGPQALPPARAIKAVLPIPAAIESRTRDTFTIGADTVIAVSPSDPDAMRIARALAEFIRRTVGALPRLGTSGATGGDGRTISLSIDASLAVGDEGYDLAIVPAGVTLRGRTAAGLFYGVQRSASCCRTGRSTKG